MYTDSQEIEWAYVPEAKNQIFCQISGCRGERSNKEASLTVESLAEQTGREY